MPPQPTIYQALISTAETETQVWARRNATNSQGRLEAVFAEYGIGSLRVRGGVLDEHLTRSAVRLIAHGRLCLMQSTSQFSEERHLAREQDALGQGIVPVEEAFSDVQEIVRRAEARTHEALVEAMEAALPTVSPYDAAGFFRHCS